MLSPTAPACVPQDHLEPVLLEHLRSLGGARVHLHTEVVGVENLPDGVEVVLRDVPTGDLRTVRARYLVAADGAHSRIRTALGIAMRGPDGLAHVVTALFRAPLWRLLGEHRYGIYCVDDPHGAGTFLPAGRGDRWVYGTWVDPQDVEGYTPERLRAAHPRRRRHRRPRRLDRAHRRLQLRRPAGRPLPRRQRLPRRRRRPPRDPARRHRDEHRDPRRARPGLEARLGAARLGRARAAGHLRGRAAADRRPQRRPVRRSRRLHARDRRRAARRPRRAHPARVGRTPTTGRVSTLDLLGPGLTLFTGPDSRRVGGAARPAGRRSPSAAWTPSARARSASAVAARCSCAPTARPRGCGRRRRRPPPELLYPVASRRNERARIGSV